MDFSFLLSNSLINMGVISWIVAQLIKTGLDLSLIHISAGPVSKRT